MNRGSRFLAATLIGMFAVSTCVPFVIQAQKRSSANGNSSQNLVDGITAEDLKTPDSEMRPLIESYVVDRGSLTRSYPGSMSPARRARFQEFYAGWLATLEKLRSKVPECKVVMLSTYDNPTYIARAVALGAADYVLKGSSRGLGLWVLAEACEAAEAATDAMEDIALANVRTALAQALEALPS